MAIALDIITDALLMLQVYAPGEVLTDADAEQGLSVLNDMLDSWSNEDLMTYAIFEQEYQMVPGQSQITIGPGGNINTVRPLRLIDGPGAAYIQDLTPGQNNYPVNVVPRDVWNMIGSRTVNSNVPDTLFYDPQYPLGIINLFPVPNLAWNLFFDSYQQLTEFANLYSELTLPVGYKKALQDCLAVELKPYFKTGPLDPMILAKASNSKGNIKRTNLREVIAVYDTEIVSRAAGSYNIYSDRGG